MKFFTILLFILLLSTNGISQTYYPIIKNNKSWDQGDLISGAPGCYGSLYRYEFIDGSTIQNGTSYRNSIRYPILGTPGSYGTYCPPFYIWNNPYYFAQMREDTIARKVYIYLYNETPTDQLLYDFTLNIGDTLQSSFAGSGYILTLKSIVDVTLSNGSIRKKYCFDDQCEAFYIEEIGGRNGLFKPIIPIYGQIMPVLLCVKDNDQVLWGGWNCDIYNVGIFSTNDEFVSVSPNPSQEKISINLNMDMLPANIELVDLQGKSVFCQEIYNSKSNISVSYLKPGMYFYRIRSSKITKTGKIILN